jgi:signal transduction histidine kinase/CheY-like chemotaxis protein
MIGTGLLQLSRALHSARDLGEMMQCVRVACQQNTRYDRIYVMVAAPDKRSLEVVGYVFPDTDVVRTKVAAIALDKDPFLQQFFVLNEPRIILDMRLDPLADQKQVEIFGSRTLITIPMLNGDDKLGPLSIATFADQGVLPPTDVEMDFFKQVGSLVSVVIARFRAEKAREELEAKLLSTQKLEALGRLAGEVAHDFNNLLLIIRGNTELASDELQHHPALPFIDMIRDATIRASGLSRQLLAFSRGQVLTPQVLNLNPLVENCVKLVRDLVPKNIITQKILTPHNVMVNADSGQLEQVIMNLVINARDAVEDDGRIVIETQLVVVDEEFIANHTNVSPGRYALLMVSDNGHGMDMETQGKIFEPFFTTKPADKGTGLGLAVVQGIVGQHHGHIHVYSELNVGTTFKVYLPICEQSAPEVGHKLPARSSDLHGTEIILVVDDQEHVKTTVSTVLMRAGYTVHVAGDAQAALALLEKTKVDLLLTDIVMPGINGISLATIASERYPQLQLLLMTGYAPSHFREVTWAHITKPFTPTELLLQIKTLLSENNA